MLRKLVLKGKGGKTFLDGVFFRSLAKSKCPSVAKLSSAFHYLAYFTVVEFMLTSSVSSSSLTSLPIKDDTYIGTKIIHTHTSLHYDDSGHPGSSRKQIV